MKFTISTPPLHAHSPTKEEKLRYEGVSVSFTEPLRRRLRRKMSARLCGVTREREPGGSENRVGVSRGAKPRERHGWRQPGGAAGVGAHWGALTAPAGSGTLRTGPLRSCCPGGWRTLPPLGRALPRPPPHSSTFAGSGVTGTGAAGGWTNRTASPCPLLTLAARLYRPRRGANPEPGDASSPARPGRVPW